MENLERLRSAFTVALGLPPEVDPAHAQYGVTDGWDSVAHMALIAEIESAFDIMLDTDEVIGMSSFLKATEIVSAHGVAIASQ